jgi:Tol biopolymer transport system component
MKLKPTTKLCNARLFWWIALWTLGISLIVSGFFGGQARGGTVYESQTEFFTADDFNGDGVTDVLVLDKNTGNARVGYMDSSGNINWSKPLATGTENVSGFAAGTFLSVSRDSVAVTSPDLNRVNIVDLSNSNAAPSPTIVSPMGIGAHSIAALPLPLGGTVPSYDYMLVASSLNSPPAERLDFLGLNAGVATSTREYEETGAFDRPNTLTLSTGGPTLACGIVRGGTNDAFDIWQFTNSPGVLLTASNLPTGVDYAFGKFNGESLPRFLFYQPGQTNLSILQLVQSNGVFYFGSQLSVPTANPALQVFYTDLGTNGAFQINYGGSIQALSLPGGAPSLGSPYASGAGSVFTGMAPLANGTFALFDSPEGDTTSTHASVVHFDGKNYTQISAGNLPVVTTSATRANVWLFDSEPFVSRSLGFVESLTAPDWSVGVSGLPGSDNVLTESDGGATNGLSVSQSTTSFGAPPGSSKFALVNQYNDVISVFSYGSPRPPDPANVLISPSPGNYQPPIQVSFNATPVGTIIYYNTGPTNGWQKYSAPFQLVDNTTVNYFGSNASTPARSRLQSATYFLGSDGPVQNPVVIKPGTDTNAQPPININEVVLSSEGTVFYGRRAADNTGSIWCINLDGSGETYITSGARPRMSRNGKWLAFLRDGNPFANTGNLYVRNISTGEETMLVNNTNTIVHFDWDSTGTNLIFDYDCLFYQVNVSGIMSPITSIPVCESFAPAINPTNGSIAYFLLTPGASGIFIASPNFSTKSNVSKTVTGARWPEWSPDGQSLVFANGPSGLSVDAGQDLWVVNANGTGLSSITAIGGDGVNGFPHGAAWSPDGESLIAAGTIYGANGLWIIPLNDDHTACDCAEVLTPLPISPGDPVDFVGSMLVAPRTVVVNSPKLQIRLDPTAIVVYWSTNILNFSLQTAEDLTTASTNWGTISGPYGVNGNFFEYSEPRTNLVTQQFFRLSQTQQ